MAYQLHNKTSTERRFDDFAAARPAWMRIDETLSHSPSTPIQFFVRTFSGGKTLVLQADSSDTVASVHRKIQSITGIRSIQSTSGVPEMEQRLIYRGKQLQLHQTLSECGIQNDDTLQLVGRMRSTRYPHTWRLMNDLNSLIYDLCNCSDNTEINDNVARMTKMLTDYLAATPRNGADEYLQIFIQSSVPAALDIFPFVDELATRLSRALELSERSTTFTWLSDRDVHAFIKFMHPVKSAIRRQEAFGSPVCFRSLMQGEARMERFEIEGVHRVFCNLLEKLELCLKKLESQLGLINNERGEPTVRFRSRYLLILKELESISKLYKGLEKMFWKKMRQRRVALCFLIVRLSKRSIDYQWILEHKEVTNFKIRQRFALKMLREGRHKNEELYEMLVRRSHLFEDSFGYIGHASPRSLRGDLFIQFENEEATGPGVLREWFSLVCQAIFNPQNGLFVFCPNDGRRFFPNPASKVDPLHLEYFIFSGRMIALALLHTVQISIEFDRVFFLQLAGEDISFEDIRDADPYLYSGCKKILEMDAKMVDEDILGLTFVCEDEELGSTKVVELCPNGKYTMVNSKNRDKYVNLLVKHRFVTSIAQQVAHFARGFADIITNQRLRESFFRILDHEDLNRKLHGSKTAVSVEDWKEHTKYNGYKNDDPQISWFWEIVGSMSAEQRNVLLFFWTSIKSLPVEGFGGLHSKLHIYRTSESHDCLPSSHTCFYHLCFPPYPSMDIMQNRLNIITQNYIGCSFGAS